MDGRELLRSMKVFGSVEGLRTVRSAWRQRRTDAWGTPPRGAERARVPGLAEAAESAPGGGTVRFARSSLRVCVSAGGTVFWGWDGAGPLPSYALAGEAPEADPRAALEPDTDGGWRIVSERVTVAVSRHGAVEVRTPGGLLLRRDLPPRWWEPVETSGGAGPSGVAAPSGSGDAPGTARWVQRSEVPADARFFGLGGRSGGLRLRDGSYRLRSTASGRGAGLGLGSGLWSGSGARSGSRLGAGAGARSRLGSESRLGSGSGSGSRPGSGDVPSHLAMPVQFIVSDAGTHLVFHDTSWDGRVTLSEGEEGAGSGHDRPGTCEVRMAGGPLRCWVVVGTPARVLHGWAALTGAPALPPSWALGPQHARQGSGDAAEVREAVDAYRKHGLPLSAVHLDAVRLDAGHPGAGHSNGLSGLAEELWKEDVRLVAAVDPAVRAEPGNRVHDGDRRETSGVCGLAAARAGYEGLRRLRPDERPFLLSRSGWAGTQRYGGTWTGEVPAGWPGLRGSLSLVLGLGLCGVPYSGPDVEGSGPGSGSGPDAGGSPELFLRRYQLAAWLPLFRTRAGTGPEPWEFGPEILEYACGALAERERLRPYFTTLARLARMTGAPYVRPVWWGTPEDRTLRDCEDAFLLGDSLLVAPVLAPGADRRAVRLPRGRWYDTATGRAYEGPGQVLLDAPLSRVPVLARAGAVLPVRGEEGGPALEVWAPAAGRTGGGLVVRDTGDGWEPAEIERYQSRLVDGRVVVERVTDDGVAEAGLPVRVRGL
ncbi:glycoside hydrolase family 31 protein [Streptomyces sp. NPDC085463]|uniref:glycoside hydrolase family 31 protein n=1 Tax=Streptomyces sp. NPDC085463 TaxID=3365724 RepID=UPI0037D60639